MDAINKNYESQTESESIQMDHYDDVNFGSDTASISSNQCLVYQANTKKPGNKVTNHRQVSNASQREHERKLRFDTLVAQNKLRRRRIYKIDVFALRNEKLIQILFKVSDTYIFTCVMTMVAYHVLSVYNLTQDSIVCFSVYALALIVTACLRIIFREEKRFYMAYKMIGLLVVIGILIVTELFAYFFSLGPTWMLREVFFTKT